MGLDTLFSKAQDVVSTPLANRVGDRVWGQGLGQSKLDEKTRDLYLESCRDRHQQHIEQQNRLRQAATSGWGR